MASTTEELKFPFYLILINFNVNSQTWPVAAILDGLVLDNGSQTWLNIRITGSFFKISVPTIHSRLVGSGRPENLCNMQSINQ